MNLSSQLQKEKQIEKEAEIGGRIQYDSFYGEEMKMGGGILRKEDKETQTELRKSDKISFSQERNKEPRNKIGKRKGARKRKNITERIRYSVFHCLYY